jgi:catechol-2,3-dioxygenase
MSPKVTSPTKLAHVVLRTNNKERLTTWYETFLGAHVVYSNPMIAFMTYDDEHHRIAVVQIPELGDKVRHSCGLEHVAFTFASLGDLLRSYRERLALEEPVKPVWCVNHRVTTSLYYKDCDGNLLGGLLSFCQHPPLCPLSPLSSGQWPRRAKC